MRHPTENRARQLPGPPGRVTTVVTVGTEARAESEGLKRNRTSTALAGVGGLVPSWSPLCWDEVPCDPGLLADTAQCPRMGGDPAGCTSPLRRRPVWFHPADRPSRGTWGDPVDGTLRLFPPGRPAAPRLPRARTYCFSSVVAMQVGSPNLAPGSTCMAPRVCQGLSPEGPPSSPQTAGAPLWRECFPVCGHSRGSPDPPQDPEEGRAAGAGGGQARRGSSGLGHSQSGGPGHVDTAQWDRH